MRRHRRTIERQASLALPASLALLMLAGCASARPLTRARAVEAAQRSVCGAPHAGRDSTCAVRSAAPIPGGYRVVLDRRPPAGNDHLAIEVRRGGDGIEVFPIDSATAARAPR